AKKPADRPQTAAHLARAAQALRRGDVAGAAAAVPGIEGVDPIAAFVSPGGASTTSAMTRVMPSGGSGRTNTAELPQERRRSPWTWPLVAAVSVLAVAVAAIIIVLAIRPTTGGGPTTSSPPPTSPTSTTPTAPTITPTSNRVNINPSDYVGEPFETVRESLVAQDLVVNELDDHPAAPDPDSVGTVQGLNPTGNVTKGSTINVRVYGAFPTPSAPTAVTAPAGPFVSGEQVTVTFPTYNGCPSGHPLSGYQFNLGNATFSTGSNLVSSSATSLSITLGTAGTDATVSYAALCGPNIPPSSTSGTTSITVN
ncbi:MAG: serine/threonine protein kinase, partial [Pseudolysinimonas sp.]